MLLLPLLPVLTLLSGASATFHTRFHWGASHDLKTKASSWLKQECNVPGSFFSSRGSELLCCSSKTRTPPPRDDDCPFDWSWHKTAKCCIPPKEESERDCGEGFVFDKSKMKCEREQVNKCGKHQWWWKRQGECRDWDWGKDKGICPKGKKCPKGWSWSKKWGKCKPDGPRAPEPDCKDWRDKDCWCGPPPGPEPTKKISNPKRDLDARRQQVLFPQSDFDMEYCPKQLHACTVPTGDDEWAYECVDFESDLESCGGCAVDGEGQDCTKIPGAQGVGCERGTCRVYSCDDGLRAEGSACVGA